MPINSYLLIFLKHHESTKQHNPLQQNQTLALATSPVCKTSHSLVSLDVAKCGKDFQEKCSNVALTRRSDLRPDADFPGEGSCHL